MRTTALALLLILAGSVSAWALGSRENSLVYVDRLITNQRYDEAILYLTDFIKNNPELFDAAQQRMRRITKIRTAYNQSAATLIEVLKNDPLNQEKKLAIIAELESYERTPNPAIKEFVAKTKELALFTYNQAQFEEIMERGRFLIDDRKFLEAAQIYETGFALYRPEFSEAGFDQAIVDEAFRRVATVSGDIIRFGEQSRIMSEAFSALSEAFQSHDEVLITTAWNRARAVAVEFASLRKDVVDNGRFLEAVFVDLVSDDPAMTDNSFLPFAFRLITGRKSEGRLEGIAGAIDAQWVSALGGAQATLEAVLQSGAAAASAACLSGDWAAAESEYQTVAADAARAVALLSLWSHYAASDIVERSTAIGQAVLQLKGSDYLKILHTGRVTRLEARLCSIVAALEEEARVLATYNPLVGESSKAAVLAVFEEHRKSFGKASLEIEALRKASAATLEPMLAWADAGYGSIASREESAVLDRHIEQAADRARELEKRSVAAAAGWEYGVLSSKAKHALSLLEQGKNNLYGVLSEDPALPGIMLRFPVKAQELFVAADIEFRAIRNDVDAYLAAYRAYPEGIVTAPAMVDWTTRAAALSVQAEANQSETVALVLKAKEQKRLADQNKLEAERRVSEIQVALGSNNFIAAKERLSLARERYLISLELEHSARLRAESDTLLVKLANTIRKTENDLVVTDTRLFLDKGKTLYVQGEIEQAESSLLQARMIWSTTNSKPDFEVEYWLKLVQNALAIKSKRTIPVTSPLFPEMSQILSLARRYFDEGSALLARRDRAGAVALFAQARQKILDVKVVFPANQEACILDLKIDQAINIDEFNKRVADMIATAKKRMDTGTELTKAYNDLKDLESIQPHHPGLRALRERAEILVGFRRAPSDPKSVAEARSLIQSAKRIYDSGQIENFHIAQAQLEQALALDPDNEAGSALKDRIATRIGGDAVIVLTSVAEALYNEAANFFMQGDYRNARTRLARLTDVFPQGRTMKKVSELDGRLSSMGY